MKKISLYVLAMAAVLLLCMMPAASAETLADCINNLVLPKQRYNIDRNQSYEMNNFTDASVNPQTGEFVMRQTDYTLPGRNGLDVNLTRIYRSGQATKYEMYTVMEGGVLKGYIDDHYYNTTSMSFLEHRHSIGAGWKFSFPELEIMNSSDGTTYRYLHTESGAVYRLLDPVQVDGVDTYKLEGYKLDDKVVKAYDGSFPEAEETPKYMLVEKDGRKAYFSDDISHYYGRTSGVILGIKDRYGNCIKFSYQDINYTGEYYYHDGFSEGFYTVFKLLDKITDSVGREIHFEYQMYGANQYPAWSVDGDGDLKHKFDVKVTTPDGQMIIYNKSSMRKSGEWGASTRERLQGVYTLSDASQYGVNGNYGEMKYYYGYEFAQYPFAWDGSDYTESITGYGNYWENIDFVAFGETNRAKEIDYMYAAKRFGDRGQGEARKVKTERDILLQSYTPKIAPLYWAVGNENTVESFGSYVGDVVDRQSYYYATERYTGDTPEMKNIMQLSFEDENDLKRIISVKNSGSVHEDTGWSWADTGYMSTHSLTNWRQSGNTKGSITLGKPGSYILHMKVKEVAGEQGAGTFTLGIEKADGSVTDKVIPVTSGEEWQTVEELLTDCSGVILKYNSTGGNFYIDDLVIGEGYYTVVNKLEEEPYLSDYQKYYYYSYDNLLRGTKESHIYGSEKSINWEYDERNQPSLVTTTVRDGYYDSDESQMHYDPGSIQTEQQYSYDNYGNLLSYNGPEYNGAHVEYTYAPPEKFHTVTSKMEKDGEETILSKTEYTVNDKGEIIAEVQQNAEGNVNTAYTYDTYGNLLIKTAGIAGGQSFTEGYEYGAIDSAHPDSTGLYLTKRYVGSNQCPTWYTYDYNTGLCTSEKQNNGAADIIKSYEYDAKRRLIKLSENRGDTIYRYHYKGMDLGGGVSEYNKIVEVETPKDHVLYTYNIYGDILSVKDFDTKAVRTAYDYSKRIDNETKLSTVTDANGNKTIQYENEIGQMEKITYADGSAAKVSYLDKTERLAQYGAEQSVTVTDENGAETTHYLDKAGRVLATETSPDGQTYYAVKHTYDARGNKVKTTDARGNVTTFEYDMLRQLVKKTDAIGGVTAFSYDGLGNVTEKQEPGGKLTQYSYDFAGRVSKERTGFVDTISDIYVETDYQYNGAGGVTQKAVSYLEAAGGEPHQNYGLTRYVYDNKNRVSKKVEVEVGTNDKETYYSYDYNGNLTMEKTFADREQTGYIAAYSYYDNQNRLVEQNEYAVYQNEPCGRRRLKYFYDNGNHVTQVREYAGDDPSDLEEAPYTSTFYEYDLRYRVTKQTDPSGVVTEYEYDNAGNATKQTLSAGGKQYSTTRQYDLLGRLTSETNALNQTTRYGYDANNNRTITVDARYAAQPLESAPSIRQEYDVLNRLVKTLLFENGTSTVTQAREYDGRGNVTKTMDGEGYVNGQVGTVMTYDFAENMVTVASASAAAAGKVSKRTAYDAFNRPVLQTVYKDSSDPGANTHYGYDFGLLTLIVDPFDNREYHEYDLTGQLYEKVTDKNGGVTKIFKSLFGTPYRTEYPDGTTETVDFDWYLGLAIAVADRKGRKKKYKYNVAKQVTEESFCYETDADGVEYFRVITYTYDAFGLLAEQKLSRQHGTALEDQKQTVTYTYDALFRPTAVEKSDGSRMLRQYDAAGNVTREQQRVAQGKYEERGYSYDAFGRKISDFVMVDVHKMTDVDTEGFEPQITSYSYNKSGMVQTATDANGHTTAYVYNADGQLAQEISPSGAVTQYSYDFAGNLVQETNAIGGYTKYGYDALGRISEKKTNAANDTDGELTWTFGYDAVGNLTSEQTPAMVNAGTDKKMTHTYDSMNRKTASYNAHGRLLAAHQYDAMGNVTKTVDGLHALGASELGAAAGTTYTYDSFDRVVRQVDAAGNVATTAYNLRGDVTSQTDAKGQTTTYAYNEKGRLASISYPDGGQVGYTYDDKGRVLTKATKQSDSVTLTESYTYTPFDTVYQYTDAAGNETKTLCDGTGKPSSVTDARGTKTRYSYNSDGRLAQKTIPMTAGTNYTESYTYDGAGNVLTVTLTGDGGAPDRMTSYTYRPGGQVATVLNNAGALTEYSYDGAGNLAEQKVLRGYDGGAQYDTVSYTYDIYDRPVTMVQQLTLGGSGATTPAVTSYTYNVMGMKTSETTPRSANAAYDGQYTTNYAYDTVGRLSQVSRRFDGQTVTTQYVYDVLGNPVSVTDEAGHTTQYTYDAGGRVSSVTDALNQTTSYEYDLAGNRTKEVRPNGTWAYEYDAMNRLSVTKNPDGAVVQKLLYDVNGNIVKQIDANGYAAGLLDSARYGTTYTYNLANLVERVTTPEGHTTTYAYTPQGDVKSVTDGTGHTTSYSYNAAGNLASVTNGAGETTAYTYDVAGNRIKMTDGLGHVTEYEYGAFGLLLSVTDAAGKSIGYTYDLEGNVASMTDRGGRVTEYGYDNRGKLTSKTAEGQSVTYSYDVSGNRTGMTDSTGTYMYSYDALNRMTAKSKNGAVQISYGYDAVGQDVPRCADE